MSKYIDAASIVQACYDSFLETNNKAYVKAMALIAVAPTANVVEAVRCEHCSNSMEHPN